ncbi:DNA mismatch repair protein MutT [Sulfitobacter sp.]|uniref:NUDIX hydrolase n=1 Tax=Sulfitobacter sp. TaxID=1903071 RepID=UPI003567CAC9
MTIDKTQIRNASTVIVIRDRFESPRILMGQRGSKAVFMPNKFVFPGGAVDKDDAGIALASPLNDMCRDRLAEDADATLAHAIAVAGIRELWEETGLILGQKGDWQGTPHDDWASFANRGYVPDASALQFVFRALTPPGRPRRFDARFFLVDADAIATDLDDFDAACDELSHLQWVALSDARSFDMPFITEVVLAEVEARAKELAPPASVPFFKNNDEESLFLRLRGRPMQD